MLDFSSLSAFCVLAHGREGEYSLTSDTFGTTARQPTPLQMPLGTFLFKKPKLKSTLAP